MKKRTKPELKPMDEYPAPAYPSYRDPEPKAWLQVNPYPWGGTIAGSLALGALGLLGVSLAAEHPGGKPVVSKTDKAAEFCTACAAKSFTAGKSKCATCGGDSGSPQLKHCAKCAGKKDLCRMCGRTSKDPGHPFSVSKAGFPTVAPRPGFGTGRPSQLSEQDARKVIERIFKGAGLELAADTDPKLKGVSVELDGWDAKEKVGYEFVTYSDYDYLALGGSTHYNEAYRKRMKEAQAKNLSITEIRELEAMSNEKQAHVATINAKNYTYMSWGRGNDPTLQAEVQAKYKEFRAAKGDAKKQAEIRAEIQELQKKIRTKAAEGAVKKLEKDVRAYLTWLKKQGAL